MVVLRWDIESRLGALDYLEEEEEEKRMLIKRIGRIEKELEEIKKRLEKLKAEKERYIDVDSDCEIWS